MYKARSTDLEGLAAGQEKDLARAITNGVRGATEALKGDIREATAVAFSLSNRLPKAWRSQVFPRSGDSVDASGWIAVKSTAAKIIQSAAEGTLIRARGRKWLAIPTDEAGKFGLKAGATSTSRRGGRERITPAGFERRTGIPLRFVKKPGEQKAYLVADGAMLSGNRRRPTITPYRSKGRGSRQYGPVGRSFVAFTLVRAVQMRKRLDLDVFAARAAARGLQLIHMG